MATQDQVAPQIRAIIMQFTTAAEDDITLDADFFENLGLTSLDAIKMTLKVEETFGIEIPEADVEGIKNVRNLVDFVVNHTP